MEQGNNPDKSELDSKYFIDEFVYNCPFCKRGNVKYTAFGGGNFDWANEKECYIYFVRCESCKKVSMHLTYEKLETEFLTGRGGFNLRFVLRENDNLDDKFFYSVPTSFFTLDSNIPSKLRELMSEAEGCLKSNFLTGASACARKIIYELAVREKAEGDNYDERIKSLKKRFPEVDENYFDTLSTIQSVTSDKVHEVSYDGWSAKHLRLILATIKEILTEIYVLPALKKKKRASILELSEEISGNKPNKKDSEV